MGQFIGNIVILLIYCVHLSVPYPSRSTTCSEKEFSCFHLQESDSSTACVEAQDVCDGKNDCSGGEDENKDFCENLKENITCTDGQFRCDFGGCIERNKVCDATIDCYDGSDERLDTCANNTCLPGWFRCGYGSCVPPGSMCSGKADCPDERDESSEVCLIRPCPPDAFRCRYGACVELKTKCDGQKDCNDGSDEDEESCFLGEEAAPSCSLPPPPTNGQVEVLGCSQLNFSHPACQKNTGSQVPSGSLLRFVCNGDLVLAGVPVLVCRENGTWSAPTPKCLPASSVVIGRGRPVPWFCPRLKAQRGISVTYEAPAGLQLGLIFDQQPIDPDNEDLHGDASEGYGVPAGTIAHLQCAVYYVLASAPTSAATLKRCREDGTWSGFEGIKCQPDCGKSEAVKRPLVTHGNTTKQGEWPWHAAIYLRNGDSWEYICGGSLLNDNAVITAAHCVTHSVDSSIAQDPSNLRVILGKHERAFNSVEKYAQSREVQKVLVHDSYNPSNFDSDLGLLLLASPLQITAAVRPVCFLRVANSLQEELQLQPGNEGVVVGWGRDENGHLADDLRMAHLGVVEPRTCMEQLQLAFRSQVRYTTFCASGSNSTNVCNGDSGGGLVFPYGSSWDKRWFLHGVVSVGIPGPDGFTCDASKVTFFTRVAKYAEWIVRVLAESQAAEKTEKGTSIESSVQVRVQVQILCPPLIPSQGVVLKCVRAETLEPADCREYLPAGSVIRYHCGAYYKPSNVLLPGFFGKCRNDGTWTGDGGFGCVPDCGRSKWSVNNAFNGEGYWPWHVGIYQKINDLWTYKCSGVLLNSNTIITATECMTEANSMRTVSPNKLKVLLGSQTLLKKLPERLEVDGQVESVWAHPKYNQSNKDWGVTLVVLRKELYMSATVRPVCLPKPTDTRVTLTPGTVGLWLSWQESSSSRPYDVVSGWEASVLSQSQCQLLPHENNTSINTLHYCAFATSSNAGIPKAGIGNGMIFPTGSDYDRKWMLHGINIEQFLFANSTETAASFIRITSVVGWVEDTLTLIQDARRVALRNSPTKQRNTG